MLEKIDSHHHLWRYNPGEYDWINDRMAVLKRDFLPVDLHAAMTERGISGAVSVQARQSLDETWSLLKFADENDFIRAVVGWVPLTDPDLQRLLPTIAEDRKLRGVRHVLQDEPDENYMLGDDFNRGIEALRPFHLVYDILIHERHLPQSIEFVDRHPEQVFVLDHVAKPRIGEGILSPWRENMLELTRRPNVYCKISGMVTEADWSRWTPADLRPYIDTAIEAFGPRRIMFGSDWPVCLLAASYAAWHDLVATAICELSTDEQARIWSGTAIEAYRL
jgi:L-fuconolactonase